MKWGSCPWGLAKWGEDIFDDVYLVSLDLTDSEHDLPLTEDEHTLDLTDSDHDLEI